MPPPNNGPIVIIEITPGDLYVHQPVTIDVSKSYDEQGTIKNLKIHPGDGTKPYSMNKPAAVIHKYRDPGTYEIYAEATDNKGSKGSNKMLVGILEINPDPPVNQPPNGVLSLVQALYVSTTVIISTEGSSSDVDHGKITWGDGEETLFTGQPQANYTHPNQHYAAPGTYPVELYVTDAEGLEDATRAVIQVVIIADPVIPPDPPYPPGPDPLPVNIPPIAVLNYVSGQYSNQPYTFSTVGTIDPDGQTFSGGNIKWNNVIIQSWSGAPPATLVNTPAQPGSYTVIYSVTDSGMPNLTSTITRTVVIQVPPQVNRPPFASILQTSGIYVGDSFVFALVASDPDSNPITWSFNPGDGSANTNGAGPFQSTLSHIYGVAATRTVIWTVTDSFGLVTPVTTQVTILADPDPPEPPSGDRNDYYDMLAAGPLGSTVMWKSSGRATSGTDSPNAYWNQPSAAYHGTNYVFLSGDPYHSPKDGTKITLPTFLPTSTDWVTAQLASGINSGATSMTLNTLAGDFDRNNLHWLIGGTEVIATGLPTGLVVPIIQRGMFGTTPASHLAGALVQPVRHSLGGQCWKTGLTLGDGFDYLFTQDIWLGPETVYGIHGAGNAAGKSARIDALRNFGDTSAQPWIQLSFRADRSGSPLIDHGLFEYWWYGNINYTQAPTKDKPMSPLVTEFRVLPSRWTRTYQLIKQRAGATPNDRFWSWVTDETTDPVLTHNGNDIICELYGTTNQTIWRFIEFHSSTDGRLEGMANTNVIPPEQVSYMSNNICLRFPADTDISSLLEKPVP